jgi:hypothetical protein
MLKIRFGELDESVIYNVRAYFDARKKVDWFSRPMVRKAIKGIDKSDVIAGEVINSPVLGAIPPQLLSEGCKAVILMDVLDNPSIYGTECGDNCVPDILEIASRKDITITLHHAMKFPDKFDAYLVDLDKYIHSREEFIDEYYKFIRKVQ